MVVVLVFGTICVDRVRRVPRMPEPGGYVETTFELDFLGGEAANTANALLRWGVEVELAGNGLGEGSDAVFLEQELASKKLRPVGVHLKPWPITPVCDVFVDDAGTRTMIGAGFSDMWRSVDPARLPYRKGDWFTAEPNMGDVARESLRRAHAAGMLIYAMDFASPDDPIPEGAFWQSSTDWAGTRGNVSANLEWATNWSNRFGCHTILTDGAYGCCLAEPGRAARHFDAVPCPEPVDSTGAGDVFRAGMLYGLSLGWDVERCIRFASAAGCLACAYLSSTSRVPSVREIESIVL